MKGFNSDLKNLFKNFKQQQQYNNNKAFDANKDREVNSGDRTYLLSKKENLLSNNKLFDVNGDGKFNQADIDMFVKGDVNGNKKITKEELSFVSAYKNDMKKAFIKNKVNFTLDGETYRFSKDGTYTVTSKVLAKASDCEISKEKKYDASGKLISDEIRVYQTKSKAVYMLPLTEGLDVSKITSVSSNKDGTFTVTEGNDKFVFGDSIKEAGKLTYSFVGQENINGDGSKTVKSKTLKTVSGCEISTEKKYDAKGKLISDEIKVYQTKSKAVYMLPLPDGLDISKITSVSSNKDGTFTVTAGNEKFVFGNQEKVSGKLTYSFIAQVNTDDTTVLNDDGSLTVTTKVLEKPVSGCEIYTEKKYDAEGKLISDEIRIYQTEINAVYMLPNNNSFNLRNISKVNSDGKGTFKIYVKDTENPYEFKNFTRINETQYNDGSKVKLETVYNGDGSYDEITNKYNKGGELKEISVTNHNQNGQITNINEFVDLKYNKETGKYKGKCNIRTRDGYINEKDYTVCTRTTYNVDDVMSYVVLDSRGYYICNSDIAARIAGDENISEFKEYFFRENNEYSIEGNKLRVANVRITSYDDGSVKYETGYILEDSEGKTLSRYYIWEDGTIEMWEYEDGVRTKVSVTHPDGENSDNKGHNQVIHYYDAAGGSTPDEWNSVDSEGIQAIRDKYGKDEKGNYFKYDSDGIQEIRL